MNKTENSAESIKNSAISFITHNEFIMKIVAFFFDLLGLKIKLM